MIEHVAFATISSKGQVVIPKEFRKRFKKGDKLLVLNQGDTLILKNTKAFGKEFENDMEFARRVEQAWQEIDRGEFYETDEKTFLEDVEKW